MKYILPLLIAVSVFAPGFSALAEEVNLPCSRAFEGDGKEADQPADQKSIVRVTCIFPSSQDKWEAVLTAEAEAREDFSRATLKRLSISKNGAISQDMDVQGEIWLGGIEGALTLMDINFDGHDDLRVWVATSAGPNMGYDYFIFDPETERFLYSEEAGALSGFDVMFNKEARTLSVSSRSSCCAWGVTEYRWQDNKLIAFKSSSSGTAASLHVPGLEPAFMYVCGEVTYYYNSHQALESIDVDFDSCAEEETEGEGGDVALSKKEILSNLKKGTGFELKAIPKGPVQLRFNPPIPENDL